MFSWLRKRKLPADRRPPLERDERIVAWAEAADVEAAGNGVVVATNRGLFLPRLGSRLGWHEINKAVWSGRELVVTPAEVVEEKDGYKVVADLPTVSHLLLDPGELPHQIRTRVTRSVAYTSYYPVPTHHPAAPPRHDVGGVRVVARRVGGVNGLAWTVRYDPGTDADSAAVRELTAQLVAQARSEIGPAQ
jgi:hypothetical protein